MTTNTTAVSPRLHYIYDPLCGWCYAAAPLIHAAADIAGLAIELHAGGLLVGEHRRAITPQWRDYVLPHDRRIAELTGQPFGAAYTDGLLCDTAYVLDSEPPISAVLAARVLAGGAGRAGLALLERLQRAHYVEGLRIADPVVLTELAVELGYAATAFADACRQMAGAIAQAHIAASRRLLQRVGGQGFPTVALSLAGEAPQRIDIGRFLGRVDDWRAQLAVALASVLPAETGTAPFCAPGGGDC
ncbi:DsbA family protein [Tahibacter caeni]|uniref:DsbA family protein n=1 Tax=Tahibacter caeni TaxID=1453545 RepID=UPI0021488783|nr:hypothetical protein [Tahibacter caeni]